MASISNAVNSRGLLDDHRRGQRHHHRHARWTQAAASALRVTNATLEQLSVSPPTPRIGIQGVASFSATAVYNDGTAIDVTELCAWTSSNAEHRQRAQRHRLPRRGGRPATGHLQHPRHVRRRLGEREAHRHQRDAAHDLHLARGGAHRHRHSRAVPGLGLLGDGTTADLTRVATWTSSLNSVAVMSNAADSEGLATTRGQGVTTIRASWAGESDDTTLTVTNAALTSIAVTPARTITGIGVEVRYRARRHLQRRHHVRRHHGRGLDLVFDPRSPRSAERPAPSVSPPRSAAAPPPSLRAWAPISGTATLNVSSAALTGVTVTPPTGIIPVGYWRQYTATAVFADGLTGRRHAAGDLDLEQSADRPRGQRRDCTAGA